jgi:hypothetical protein
MQFNPLPEGLSAVFLVMYPSKRVLGSEFTVWLKP